MANWAPPNNGSPSATTSKRRASWFQIFDEEIGGDPSSGFTEDPCSCTLQGEPPTPQDARSRTRCTMVAKDVEWTATLAGARREREGKPEATKKQDAEELRS